MPLLIPDDEPTMEELPPVRQVFRTRSKSDASVTHFTFLFQDGQVLCTCKGFTFRRSCWHANEVKDGEDDFTVSL